jgi:glucokinase
VAIDIGGSKISAAVIDDKQALLGSSTTVTPRSTNPDVIAQSVIDRVHDALADSGLTAGDVRAVGCGCAGPIDFIAGLVSPALIPAMRRFPLQEFLTDRLGLERVIVENDATALAIGEHWAGESRGSQHALSITVSTGVGGGLVLAGRPYRGRTGNAGEFGHIIVVPDGAQCVCGARGCVEMYASGPNAVRAALKLGWVPPGSEEASGRSLAASCARGDQKAIRVVRRAGWALGIALASAASLLDLDIITVNGGFSYAGPTLWQALRESFSAYGKLPHSERIPIVHSTLGDRAGLYGAAALVLDERYSP